MSKYIALDAGHGADTWERTGGKGVNRNGEVFEEHSFNAAVVKELKRLLERNGFRILLTQPLNEKEVPLLQRTDLANKEKVDLYWSVHANASGESKADGSCCFYWHSSKEGKKLAELFAKNMSGAGIELHGNGTHASKLGSWTNLHVVRETKMTAILTENGFMTNPRDLELLRSDDYRKKVAEIHAKTICEHYGVEFKKGDVMSEPEWKLEAVQWLFDQGYLTGDEWKKSINKPLPLWAEAIVLRRMFDDLK